MPDIIDAKVVILSYVYLGCFYEVKPRLIVCTTVYDQSIKNIVYDTAEALAWIMLQHELYVKGKVTHA